VHRIAHLDLDLFATAHHTHVRAAQLTQQIQRRLRLLSQRQTQRVVLATLLHRFFHIVGDPVEPIRRTGAVEPLVRALVIEIVNPVIQPTAGVGERGEHGFLEKFAPDRLPEALDLAQRHRMLRRTADVLHALLPQHLLEPCLAAPGHELATVVGEDLAWRPPLPDRSLQHLEHRVRILLPKQSPARQVPRMIIQDPNEIDRVHPLQLKREDVDLPHRVRTRTLEASHTRRTSARLRWCVTQPRVVDHRADLLRTDVDPFVTPEIVPNPAHAVLRILTPAGDDLLL
jgi:hypothetical protein